MPPRWQAATWQNYLEERDRPNAVRSRLFFHNQSLYIDMGAEGQSHASISDLFPILFYLWFGPRQIRFKSFGRCQLEKTGYQAAAPDVVLYLHQGWPTRQPKESRFIQLDQVRLPDLVAEVSDTTLADDLDQKKQLYAALGIPEYWVVDVNGEQVLMFRLTDAGTYEQHPVAIALEGLSAKLLGEVLGYLKQGATDEAAAYFEANI